MDKVKSGPKPQRDQNTQDLKSAFEKAMKFSPDRANELVLSEKDIKNSAEEETSFNRITLNQHGLTGGMRLSIIQPTQNLLSEWQKLKDTFTTAIRPFLEDVEALDKLDQERTKLGIRREKDKQDIDRIASEDTKFKSVEAEYLQKKKDYDKLRDRMGRREPNLSSYTIFYWIALLGIGIAEWLINYQIFFFFLGVPAIAAGTTIIMGVLLAFAAHGHGTMLKQWNARFAFHRDRREKYGEYGYLALTTFAFMLVVFSAGASRYEYAMHVIVDQPNFNILGQAATIEVNPVKDASLSLLANVAAWAVGVFISFMAHDKDPEYSEEAHAVKKAERIYFKAKKSYDERRQIIEEKSRHESEQNEQSYGVRSTDVNEQRSMWKSVSSHEDAILNAVADIVRRDIEKYRKFLVKAAVAKRGAIQIIQDDKQLTPYEYQDLKMVIDSKSLKQLIL